MAALDAPLKDRVILITGAAGLLGRAAVARFRHDGARVVPVVRRLAGDPNAVVVDLATGPKALLSAWCGAVHGIVHLAAAVPEPERRADDEAGAALTRAIDAAVMGAAHTWAVPVIYASGCSLYARSTAFCDENAALAQPISPYLGAKLDGDARFAALERGCVLRISSPCGPGMRRGVVLARFITAALSGQPIELWGDGSREQDFISVRDIAAAMALAVGSGLSGVYNVASGRPVTMRELARRVLEQTGSGVGVRQVGRPDPQDGCPARYAIDRLGAAVGWAPRIALVDEIAALTLSFRDPS